MRDALLRGDEGRRKLRHCGDVCDRFLRHGGGRGVLRDGAEHGVAVDVTLCFPVIGPVAVTGRLDHL
jgi:hypothetical protein